MKTIKGYNININEGILSSTKSGKSSTIEEFLSTMFYNERYYEKVQEGGYRLGCVCKILRGQAGCFKPYDHLQGLLGQVV